MLRTPIDVPPNAPYNGMPAANQAATTTVREVLEQGQDSLVLEHRYATSSTRLCSPSVTKFINLAIVTRLDHLNGPGSQAYINQFLGPNIVGLTADFSLGRITDQDRGIRGAEQIKLAHSRRLLKNLDEALRLTGSVLRIVTDAKYSKHCDRPEVRHHPSSAIYSQLDQTSNKKAAQTILCPIIYYGSNNWTGLRGLMLARCPRTTGYQTPPN
jgi:hypothetical protein